MIHNDAVLDSSGAKERDWEVDTAITSSMLESLAGQIRSTLAEVLVR